MSTQDKPWTIYSLADPRTGAVRYVGWAYHVSRRVGQHVQRAKGEKTHKANWLNQIAGFGLKPIVAELERGTGDWAEAERRWIAHYRGIGCDLTNATDGGEGVPGLVFSDESKAKMAAAKRGRRLAPEHVAKVAAALRGRERPPEIAAAVSAAKKGVSPSEETRKRIGQGRRGKLHTDEAKAKIGAASKGRKHSEETKAKMRAAKAGKKLSEEHRRKLSEAKKGRKLSEEHRAAIRGASGGWHHTPETIARITEARRARDA